MQGQTTASPVSTGGGGDQFEQHVAAFALGLLLVRATPPILNDTSVVKVHLQNGHRGWRTDDLLLVGEGSDGARRKLALQVKRSFTVSAGDEDCQKTILGMWNDFHAADRFDETSDQFAIVTLYGTSVLLRDFSSLLLCAKASMDAEDFEHRLSLDGFLSAKAKGQDRDIRRILTEESSAPPDDDVYWRFLQTVNVLSFDFNTPTAQTEAMVLALLSHCASDGSASLEAAQNSWAALLRVAGEGRPAAMSYRRDDLPRGLLERHAPVSGADRAGLNALVEHGQTVRDDIRSTIGAGYTIERASHVQGLAAEIADHQVVIVSGVAGSGKSALACRLLRQLERTYPVLAFQAVEFATAHVDEALVNAQTSLNLQRLLALLGAHDTKVVFVDGVERLLERSVRDGFAQLLQLPQKDQSVRFVLTVRDYSLETVRNALIPAKLKPVIFEVPTLSDAELDSARDGAAALALPLGDARLRRFLRTPYLLDLASRLQWADAPFPASLREFRKKVWRDLIRVDAHASDGMPARRGRAFLDIAWRRAVELRSFVLPGTDDAEAVDALCQDSLVYTSQDSSTVYAVTHDVLEDWGVLESIDGWFAGLDGSLSALAEVVGGYPAIRRGFRQWLAERFETRPDDARELVLRTIAEQELPSYFRDDCLIAALLSKSAGGFLEGCRPRIAGGDLDLLARLVHVLRVACKESPKWWDVPGLPSQMLVPTGEGWVPTLRLVLDVIDGFLPERAQLVLGLVEDWVNQVDRQNPAPDGVREAGLIVDRLLQEFDNYGSEDALKRVLKVVVKISGAVPQFEDMIERAKTCSHRDRIAHGLMDLILTKPEGAFTCVGFPDEVITLMDARFRLTAADRERELSHLSSPVKEIEYGFGVRDFPIGSYFPASALQGPFRTLLWNHPAKAAAFILRFLNHAGDWYSTEQWPGRVLEPASRVALEIPGDGIVEQWANRRLYCLYRGNQVGPGSIVSALMALESWLLALAKINGFDLETWLLHLLRNSNNVMVTGVVASLCVAYPEKAGRAGLTLLSSRDVVQLDRERLALESSSGGATAFFGLDLSHRIFEQERVDAKQLPHRREDLELLAIRLQLTEQRDDVWSIIDRHRSELPEESTEHTRVWQLALHRMDVRGFEPIDAPPGTMEDSVEESESRVYLGPGQMEPDVQEMVDEATRSTDVRDRYLRLWNLAWKVWEGDASVGDFDWRQSLLREAQAVELDLEEPEEYYRDGQGFAAAVCIRDHLNEIDGADFEWCVRRVDFEVRRKSADVDDLDSVQKFMGADRLCASVVPLLAVHERQVDGIDMMDLLSLALTHPIHEVSRYAFSGLGAFVGEEHKPFVLRCVAAAAYQSRLEVESWEGQRRPRAWIDGLEQFESIVREVRKAIREEDLDVELEVGSLEFDEPLAGAAIRAVLDVLEQHPNWDESRRFYSRIAHWLADSWRLDEQGSDGARRDYELWRAARGSLARFALRLPWAEASLISSPVVDAATENQKEAEWFVSEMIMSADGNTRDCFWELWQRLADRIVDSPWGLELSDSYSYGLGLLDMIFLGPDWKEEAKHWHRLDGHAHRLDKLARDLPPTVPVMRAYSNFLSRVGHGSLPESFEVVAHVLEAGDAVRMAADSNVAFTLETLLRPFVYSEPHRLKAAPGLRQAVLVILDALVAGGSPSAYRMRDDFVTPSSRG